MKRFTSLAVAVALFAIGATAFAQSTSLAVTKTKPVIDGVVNTGEYSYSKSFSDLVLYINLTADALSVAVVGNTTGWVAFGLGSQKMDGATIFMGFVQKDGTVQFKPQMGRGHRHSDTTADVTTTVVKYAMKEAGGKTTLEAELKPTSYMPVGKDVLDMIYAMGTEDSFTPMHMLRGGLGVPLAK